MTSISTALRNQTALRWWAACSPEFHYQVRRDYARFLGCHDSELGTMDEFAQDADVLVWLWATYPNVLAAWEDDSL